MFRSSTILPLWLFAAVIALSQSPQTSGTPSTSPAPDILENGSVLEVNGTLTKLMDGHRLRFLVKLPEVKLANFEEKDQRKIQEVEISLTGRIEELLTNVGQNISARGKLFLQPTSPYYYNGVYLVAETVKSSDGRTFRAKPEETPKRPQIAGALYHAQVTFTPALAKYEYSAWNENGELIAEVEGALMCSLNGPSDVLNCMCMNGFGPSATGKMQGVEFKRTAVADLALAQLVLPNRIKDSFTGAVECTRLEQKPTPQR